jgi:ABC-type antimicrobial peptide transport system permease subunit
MRIEIRGSTTLTPEIIGVVPDVMYDDLRSGAERMFYVPFAQRHAEGEYVFAVRTAEGTTSSVMQQIPRIVNAVAPNMPVLALRTMARQIDERTANERLLAMISTVFGVLALILAGIGIYGIVAYTAAGRTAEIGLRLALGASYRHVLWRVVRGTAAVVATGVGIGLAVAAIASGTLTDIVFGLATTDARVYATAAAVLFVTGLLAAIPPVLRAFRVDPVVALKSE